MTVDDLVEEARRRLRRVSPVEAHEAQRRGALLIDIRPVEQRDRDGRLPGAIVIDRNVLEWRLDPASPDRIAEMTGPEVAVILVCNEGYATSLAAATLQRFGLASATDVEGGFTAWKAAGLPVDC